jgi:outer membrane receptor protein involved in Fe transport
LTKHSVFIPCVLLCLWVCDTPSFAQSEGTIQGLVLAKADQTLLPDARIILQGDGIRDRLETSAHKEGRFVFPRLSSGRYVLLVEHAGFKERRYELLLRPREVQNVTLELELRQLQESLDVRSESIPTTHSPGSTLLNAESIETLPLPQRSNLPDVIASSSPGMIRGHDDFVHIRGSEIALNPFINGVSFWENPHAVFSAGLGADYIQSVNVMTGGFPAEYGNRFGGVLDVVTKSGFNMNNTGSITMGAGSALRHNAGVEFGGHTDRLAYYFNVAAFESARFLSPPDARSIHNTGRGARSFLQFDFLANSHNSLRLVLMGDGTNFEIPKSARDAVLRPELDSFQRTRSQSLIASWDHIHSEHTFVQTSFYQKASQTRLLPNSDRYGAKAEAVRRLGTFGVKSDITRFFGSHTVKGGVDLVLLRPDEQLYYLSQPWIDFTHVVGEGHIHFRGPNAGAGVPRPVLFSEKQTGGQASVYLQDKVQLTQTLTADIGMRYDAYSLAISASHFSPRLNLANKFRTGTVLHGSYNHFFVPPPVENVLLNSAGLTRLISEIGRPLPSLRPIVEDQVEVGVMQPLGRYLKAGLTGYYRVSDNPVHTVLFPDVRIYGYANFDKGKAYGMEARVDLAEIPDLGISSYLNYALGRVWFFNPITAGFTTEAAHINEAGRFLAPMDQTHTLTSGMTYRHRKAGLWTSLTLEYGSGTPAGHGVGDHEHEAGEAGHDDAGAGGTAARVPQHFTQNLAVGWDVPGANDQRRISLQFNVENLTNSPYVVAKESPFTPGQYSIPRLFSASIRLHF